jgi:hypothetical protein
MGHIIQISEETKLGEIQQSIPETVLNGAGTDRDVLVSRVPAASE